MITFPEKADLQAWLKDSRDYFKSEVPKCVSIIRGSIRIETINHYSRRHALLLTMDRALEEYNNLISNERFHIEQETAATHGE